ncbi:MAG: hypothetical protein QXT26_08605 [Thermoproteota archaeon]
MGGLPTRLPNYIAGTAKLSELLIDINKDWSKYNIVNFGSGGIDLHGMVTAHASRHVSGGADAITSKLDYRAMNIVYAKGTYTTLFSTTSTSYVDTGLSVNVTLPATSVVLVFAQVHGVYNNTAGASCFQRIVRDATALREIILTGTANVFFNSLIQTLDVNVAAGTYTYKLQACVTGGLGVWGMGTVPLHGEIVAIAFPY